MPTTQQSTTRKTKPRLLVDFFTPFFCAIPLLIHLQNPIMKTFAAIAFTLLAATGDAFLAPHHQSSTTSVSHRATTTALSAKYNSMDEILALFPDDKPVLINFYDAATEADIKDDIFRAKNLLADRATLVR